MGGVFSASEAVEMGIEIEKNGRDFYNEVKKLSKEAHIRETFEFLAREEEEHIERFENMLSDIKRYEPAEAYPDEYFSYLRALSEDIVFTKEKKGIEAAKNVKTYKEAIELGINAEKESILFYDGMKKIVLGKGEKIVELLIKEEEEHLRKLMALKE